MTLNDLIMDVATFGDCGSFKKIKEEGYVNEEQFLEETEKSKGFKWSYYDDGRKVMIVDNPNGGWICKFVVMDGWLATYDYFSLGLRMEERKNKKEIAIDDYYDHYDDDDLYYDDADVATEDYGLEDYNDNYGWWR